jgi:hypothetical protein
MSDEVIALALGTVLAVGALAYVLYPLFFDTDARPAPRIAGPRETLDLEEQVRAYRAARPECSRCGLRPEPDAIYCSTCGARLAPPAA